MRRLFALALILSGAAVGFHAHGLVAAENSGALPNQTAGRNASAAPSFRADVLPILEYRCATCHNSDDPHGGLSLARGVAYDQIVNSPSGQSKLPRISPGEPDESYLIRKIEGTHLAAGGSGFAMPIGFFRVPDADRAILRKWVSAGAPRN
jgi:hypothetical protein